MPKTNKKRDRRDYKERYEILQDLDSGMTPAQVMVKHKLKSKQNVSRIVKMRHKIEKEFESGTSNSSRKTIRRTKYDDINKEVLKTLSTARGSNVPISGPILQQIAGQIANDHNNDEFGASDGWLYKFKKRHDITSGSVVGESDTVDKTVVSDWISNKLPKLIAGYDFEDIYNADETGLFWRALPDKTLKLKGQSCKTGVKSKQRVTALLVSNVNGTGKKVLDVIWKSKKPRCFPKDRLNNLPVIYHSSKKSWMTSEIWVNIWTKFNKRMIKEKRKVLVFVDNCTAHPKELTFSNTKFIFLPENSTSCLQPLDAGIIRSFKSNYRKELVKWFLTKLKNKCDKDDLKISLFDALYLMRKSWSMVTTTCIGNCFKKCGFNTHEDSDTECEDDCEEESSFNLWPTAQRVLQTDIDFNEYVECDEELVSTNDETIDFIPEIEEQRNQTNSEDEDVVPIVVTHGSALDSISKLRRYLTDKDECDESLLEYLTKIESFVMENSVKNLVQSKITDFFK